MAEKFCSHCGASVDCTDCVSKVVAASEESVLTAAIRGIGEVDVRTLYERLTADRGIIAKLRTHDPLTPEDLHRAQQLVGTCLFDTDVA